MVDETQQPAPTGVPDDQVVAAFDGPAPLVNKVVLTLTPTTARLSFLEFQPDATRPRHRGAVSMTIADLVELQKLLNRMLTDDNVVLQQMGTQAADVSKR